MNDIVDFDDFLNIYEQEALLVNFKEEQPLAFETLERQKIKLNRAKFESEIDNVLKFCKDAIEQTEEMLITAFLKEHYKHTYKSGKPLFLSQMKGYFEYIQLYSLANNKKDSYQQSEDSTAKQLHIPKPNFRPESIENIITTLNAFFDASQHNEFKRIIETGGTAKEKLLFRDNGNRLTDYFKKLIESDTITSCSKTDLIHWIIQNFRYTFRKVPRDYIYDTVEKTISSKENLCKKPIM